MFLTYMGDRYLELEDVDNVHLKLHPLVYTNKTWTPRKLLFRMRRDVILDVLSQVCRRLHTTVYICTTSVSATVTLRTKYVLGVFFPADRLNEPYCMMVGPGGRDGGKAGVSRDNLPMHKSATSLCFLRIHIECFFIL